MPRFSSYPAVATLAEADTFLIHQNATGLEKQITTRDLADYMDSGNAVDNIAALKAIDVDSVSDGEFRFVSGYYAVGGAGGGAFNYSLSAVGADNGGTVIAPDFGVGRWLRADTGIVSVTDFGAKGDGTTDDTVAVLAAISVSDAVFLPPGHYKVTTKISRNSSNFILYGAGPDISFIDWHGAGIAIESFVAYGAGPSLGYIRYRGFTLTDFGTGTTAGFNLGLFTKGCKLDAVKIVGFDYGARVFNAYYASFYDCDFESCGVGMYFLDRCNGFTLDNCRFTVGAVPANTLCHLQSTGVASGTTYGFSVTSCFFDGIGVNGAIQIENVTDMVFDGSTYCEVYPTDAGLTSTFLNIGVNCIGVKFCDATMIGPGDASYTGKWIHVSNAASNNHLISGLRQYRASGATLLTTTSGNQDIRYVDNSCEAPDGTIPVGTVKKQSITVAMPPTTAAEGLGDKVIPAFLTRSSAPCIRVTYTPSASVDLANRFIRVDRIDAGVRTNVLNYDCDAHMPNPVLDLGETLVLGGFNAISANVQLLVYIVKDGTTLDSPAGTVVFEYYE